MGIGAADSPRNDGGAPPDSVERQLLRDPYITMFRRPSALTSTIEQLSELGYDVRATDASTWAGVREMHPALADLLDRPERLIEADNDLAQVSALVRAAASEAA